jgi:UDP-N-acetyl-D-mannosaminuronate dehydrogenase
VTRGVREPGPKNSPIPRAGRDERLENRSVALSKSEEVVVAGLGEIGRPIFELASKRHHATGIDISLPPVQVRRTDILHICYPFAIKDFVGETARYVELLQPELTIINSTVAVGTTRAVAKRTGATVVNSPVRGKHAHMGADLLRYVKFIGAMDPKSGEQAEGHFRSLGMNTRLLSSPEATELAKLTETTYFGVLIAWAQEVERYCDQLGQDYDEVVSYYPEIDFFPPVKYFPGVIGGHCVMPNIEILSRLGPSEILEAIKSSNQQRMQRDHDHESKPLKAKELSPRQSEPTADRLASASR